MGVRKIGVVGAGAMGTGIANVAAMNGYEVVLRDIEMSYVERSINNMGKFMARSVEKGKISEEQRQAALNRVKGTISIEDLADADVSGEHLGRFVAGLAHDVALADSVHRGLGDASGASYGRPKAPASGWRGWRPASRSSRRSPCGVRGARPCHGG